MKKAILSIIGSGVFLVALVFSMNTSTVTFTEETFATEVCCYEKGSVCIVASYHVLDHYYNGSSPCSIQLQD